MSRRHLLFAAACVLAFVLAQAFQECAYHFWIPEPQTPEAELLTYLLPVDQLRALLVMLSIMGLIAPYAVIALAFRKQAPLAAILGLTFGAAFIGFEISSRSVDFFLVGQHWAAQFHDTGAAERAAILTRFAEWNAFCARGISPCCSRICCPRFRLGG